MSAYDEYDCSDLGCGPEFCDWPHCKKPRGIVTATAGKSTVKFYPIAGGDASQVPTICQLEDSIELDTIVNAQPAIDVPHRLGITAQEWQARHIASCTPPDAEPPPVDASQVGPDRGE